MSTQHKILVVEDNLLLQDSMAAWLGLAGYTVVVANDGFEGLAALSRERPDLIITDVAMPRLNGIEMIMSARQMPSGQCRIPILVLTGSFSEFASTAISAGADLALPKPVEPNIILAHLSYLLEPAAAELRTPS